MLNPLPPPALRPCAHCDPWGKINKAKAKGLLEVTVIISGNKTRRNVPGYALRRAKSRLTRNGVKAGLVNRGAGTTEDANAGGGGADDQASGTVTSSGARGRDEFQQNDQDKLGDELIRGVHSRRYLSLIHI